MGGNFRLMPADYGVVVGWVGDGRGGGGGGPMKGAGRQKAIYSFKRHIAPR